MSAALIYLKNSVFLSLKIIFDADWCQEWASIAHYRSRPTVLQLYGVSDTMSNWFENHQPQRTQIPFIQNSNQMASSNDRNRKFSEHILSIPAISKATSKLFGFQESSHDKIWLDFPSIFFNFCRFRSSILLSL